MSHDEMATHYRREADRLLSQISAVADFNAQADLLQMARQYQKLAEHHATLAFFTPHTPGDPAAA